MNLNKKCTIVLLTLLLPRSGWPLDLQLDGWRVTIKPATLAVTATLQGMPGSIAIAAGMAKTHEVNDLAQSAQHASWTLADLGLRTEFIVEGSRLIARFHAARDLKLAWPATDDPHFGALVLPEGEGLYLPFTDAAWLKRMSGTCAALSGGLSMPFWSFRLGHEPTARTLTYFVRTELRGELCLEEQAGRLAATLTHKFQQRDGDERLEIEIWFGGASPIAPALEYRERLRASGAFRSLEQKIRDNPEVAKLAGAIHLYVWGDGRKPEFIDDLEQAGARRAWIGYDQDEFSRQTQAGREFTDAAKAAGFLVGPYEAFSNAQDPRTGDALARWPGALYPGGCIVDHDGKMHRGFANRGCELSSEALVRAEPTLRLLANRMDRQLRHGSNSYFIDVDAFGELYG